MTAASPTLAANVMHFARLLRRAGLPVGPAETMAAQQALSLIDLGNRTEARTALRTAMIHRHEHQDVFDQAFNLFWRDPTAAEQAAAMALLEAQKDKHQERPPPGSRRVAEAMAKPRETKPRTEDEPPVMDAVLTVSDRERLQHMDFEAMSAAEIAEAKREIRRLALPLDLRRTRRLRADPLGPVTDLRRTIRQSLRQGGEILTIARNRQVNAPAAAGRAVRHLRLDVALRADPAAFPARGDQRPRPRARLPVRHPAVQRHPPASPSRSRGGVPDGVARRARLVRRHPHRRGAGAFNRLWARRVLAQGAIVLLITDGLDRDGARGLGGEHGSAASFLPPADLAQSAVALGGLRAKITGHPRHAAARGRVPPGAQPGQPARAGRSPVPPRAATRSLAAAGEPERMAS